MSARSEDTEIKRLRAENRYLRGLLAGQEPPPAAGKKQDDVQELVRAQEEFEQSAHLFDTVLASITDFVYVFDREGRFVYVNQALLDLWQLTLAEVLGKNFFDLQYPRDLALRLHAQIDTVFETGQTLRSETSYTSPNGTIGYYEYIFAPVLAKDGQVETVAGSTRDISSRYREQKETESLLKAVHVERERLTSVFMQAPAFIAVLRGPEHVFEMANPPYFKLVGHRSLVGKSVRDAFPEIEGQGFFEILDAVYQTGSPFVGKQMRILFQQDADAPLQERFIDFVYQPLVEADGAISGIFVHGVDLTAHKRAEEALQASEARQSLLLRLLQGQRETSDPDAMMAAASEAVGRYLGVNRVGFFEMEGDDTLVFGVSWTDGGLTPLSGTFPAPGIGTRYLAEVRAGRTLGIADTSQDPLTADSMFDRIGARAIVGAPIIRGGRWHAGLYVHHSEPRIWKDEEVVLVRKVADQTWDAVERARAENALEEHTREIEALNARLRRAMTETHHRVKNNLQLISALIDMQRDDNPETAGSELARLSANVRALGVIHDVLTQESKSDSDQENLSVKVVLEKLLSMLEQTIGRRHTLTYTIDEIRLPGRMVTSLALLTNELFSNAMKHGKGQADIRFEVEGDEARLEVCDDGPGFPVGFDPSRAGNTGLTLVESVSRHDLRGEVRYDNRPEGGGRVTVAFPL